MKLNKAQIKLKANLERCGKKVYFDGKKVRISWPGEGCYVYTFREAYRLMKGIAGNGKSVRPWGKIVKWETNNVTRATIRNQIASGKEDVYCGKHEASDPWKYD